MNKRMLNEWKKAYLVDLESIIFELKETVDKPCLIYLEGELGAGKTTFVSKFTSQATSPTYSLIHEYGDILHADFYRLNNASELIELELPLYFENKNFILIEWGLKFHHDLERFLENEVHCYLLEIELNEAGDSSHSPSRNYCLSILKNNTE